MTEPTEAQVEAVLRALYDEGIQLPYAAHVRDFVVGPVGPPPGPERDAALARLRAADAEAEAANRECARRVARAVLGATDAT